MAPRVARLPTHQLRRLDGKGRRCCTFGQCMTLATCRLSWKYGFDQDACDAHAKQWLTFHRIKGHGDEKAIVQRIGLDGHSRTLDYWEAVAKRNLSALRKRGSQYRNAV